MEQRVRCEGDFMIKANPLWIGTGVVFILMLVVIGVKYYQVNSLKKELAKCTLQVANLSNALENQNKSIEDLKIDSEKRKADAAEAIKKAKAETSINKPKIITLRELVKSENTCEQAVEIAKGLL